MLGNSILKLFKIDKGSKSINYNSNNLNLISSRSNHISKMKLGINNALNNKFNYNLPFRPKTTEAKNFQ